MIYNILMIVIGIISSIIIFYHFPDLEDGISISSLWKEQTKTIPISIIIPVRNEEKNISFLLRDLKNQSYPIHEIICVDDGSTDATAFILRQSMKANVHIDKLKNTKTNNMKVVKVKEKPKGWMGKSYACFLGSKVATGELLLFLDADVRISSNGIGMIANVYDKKKCTISVLPYHVTYHFYEQLSFFFQLIISGANGINFFYKGNHVGLFGPVILISKKNYFKIGGHSYIRNSIVDDISIGKELKKQGLKFRLYHGGRLFIYRMYGNGVKELTHGWIKNFATGAKETDKCLLLMIFLWVSGCILASTSLLTSIVKLDIKCIIIYFILYCMWAYELYRISKNLGRFKWQAIAFFPMPLIFFIYVVIHSLIIKVFKRNVVWKDRIIKLEK